MRRSRDLYKVSFIVAIVLAVFVVFAGLGTNNTGFFLLGFALIAVIAFFNVAWKKLHTSTEQRQGALDKAVAEVISLGKANLERSDELVRRVTNNERMIAEVSFKLNTLPKLAYELREMKRGMAQMPFDIVELAALRGLLVGDSQVPVWLGGGQASIPLVEAVRAITECPEPPAVVELGTGQSTAWFALALANRGDGRLFSFEHDVLVYSKTQYKLGRLGVERFVELSHAPLVTDSTGRDMFDWFDVEDSLPRYIDVLFVDGPPLTVGGQLGRYPVLPDLAQRLRVGSVIVLDDAPIDGDVVYKWRAVRGVDFAEPEVVGGAVVLRCIGVAGGADVHEGNDLIDLQRKPDPGLRSSRSMWLGNAYECRQFGA